VILSYGAVVNIMLGAFDLTHRMHAFLLDGGKILRAVLVKRKRDYDSDKYYNIVVL
jgi:Zn-dependent protease